LLLIIISTITFTMTPTNSKNVWFSHVDFNFF